MEFINLKRQYQKLKHPIDANIQKVLDQTNFINGVEVEDFENRLAAYIGRKHCITCGNGTDALMLTCLLYGVGQNDAVFCPDMTFIASVEPACLMGAMPVFCDIDPVSYNLSPKSLAAQIEKVEREGKYRPRAVVMVDFLGNPADADPIAKLCAEHQLLLIEDAAQAVGGRYKSRKCGVLGDISTTSFFSSKPLGCYGDGGAVFTDDDEAAELLRSYKMHGKGTSKYNNIRIGMNSRLDTIQAAVLLAKLSLLEEEMEMRQKLARTYDAAFRGELTIPRISQENRSAYAQYVLLAECEEQKKYIVQKLKEADIPALSYYPRVLHTMKALEGKNGADCEYKEALRYAALNFALPFSPYLTKEEQEYVIQTVKDAWKGWKR